MKLFGHPFSSCTRKVMITLHEKNIKYDFVLVDLTKGEQKSAAHMARNPYGVVPALEDDGLMMYESRAICRYLDAKFQNSNLTPKSLAARAKMEQWAYVEQSYMAEATSHLFVQKVLNPMFGRQTDLSMIEKGRTDAHFTFNLLNLHLRSHFYFAGEEFSLADVFLMSQLGLLEASKEIGLLESYPHLKAWAARVMERPSWKQFSNK